MKALTIWQPWAALIVSGAKTIENRKWRPKMALGEIFAIHAGVTFDSGASAALVRIGVRCVMLEQNYSRGGIIGMARFNGCVEASDSPWFSGPIGWQLYDARPSQFISCSGQQGLWTLPEVIEQRLINDTKWKFYPNGVRP